MFCAIFFVVALIAPLSIYYGWSILLTIACTLIAVAIYVFIQRQTQLNIPSTFCCPLVPLIPMLGCITMLSVASTTDKMAWTLYLSYIGLGAISYFLYAYWNSNLATGSNRSGSEHIMALLDLETGETGGTKEVNKVVIV